jgi:thiamine-monophosphate kinase
MNEVAIVEWLRRQKLVSGIGDDCAVFRPRAGEDLLFTTDQMIEGVHFRSALRPAALGQRALARSLSDIAAMGGDPRFCLVSICVPQDKSGAWIKSFFRGLLALAAKTHAPLAGGDLAADDKVRCDVMVCGAVPRGQALRRDGARPGDALYVSGPLGQPWDRPFQPRLALGRRLRGKARACIDLSDGLSLDLRRLCLASGVAAEIETVPVARGSSLEQALHGGEDYELLFSMPPSARPPETAIRIGSILRGAPGQVRLQGRPLAPRGYDHFANR